MDNHVKIDKMQYQINSTGYWLVLLALLTSLVALFIIITYDSFSVQGGAIRVVPDFRIGIEIGIGIVMLLVLFLAAEKVKYYDPTWSYIVLFVLAGINILRIFNIPVYELNQGWIPLSTFKWAVGLFAVSSASLITAGVISSRKVFRLHKYLKEKNAYGNDGIRKSQ